MNDELRIRLRLTGDQEATQSIGAVGQSIERLNANMLRLGGAAAALYAIPQALSGTVGAAIQAADSITALNNNLKLATGSAKAAGEAYSALFAIAQKSRVSFVELGGTFASITRAGEALGVSQSRLLSVTEAISNAVTVSGGSAESAKDALTQLSQGLASGALRGDELNSVMEATPRLARALADGLGVSIGGLRKLGEEGKITSAAVIRALESQSKVLSGEVANSVMTVSQAMTLLKNSATKIVGDFDAVTGASKSLAENLGSVSKAADSLGSTIKANADTINTTIGVLAGVATAAGIGYVAARVTALATSIGGVTGALVLLRATVASLNPYTLALLVGGAVVGGIVANHDEFAKTRQGIEEKIKYLERLSATDRKSLESSGADPDTNKFFLKAVSERSAKITALKKDLDVYIKAEQEALAPIGSVPSGDTALRREAARIAAQEALAKKATPKSGPSEYEKSVARGKKLYGDLIAQDSGLAPDFAEKWQDLANAHKADAKSVGDLAMAQKELLSQQPFMKEQEKERQEQAKASIKLYEDEVKAHQEKLKELDRSAASEADRMQKLQDEGRAAGIAADENISLAAAIEEVGLARVREAYASEAASSADGQTLLALQKEIQSREKIVALIHNKDVAAASETAAKKAAEDWRRAAEQIEGSITDSLLRGFESGKGFAENLRDTVTNMFKTLVLQPIVSAIVSPVAGALTGAIGLSGAATAATAAATVNGASAAVNGSSAAINGAGMLSSLGGWFTDFKVASTNAIYEIGGKLTTMGAEKLGSIVTQNATAIGGFVNAAGYAMAAVSAIEAANQGKWGQAIGTGLGAWFGGPLGGAVGNAVGSWVDSAFGGGHEYTTGTGLTGKFSKGGFSGRNYQDWRNDGSSGFFGLGGSGSSSGRNYSGMSQGATDQLSAGFASVQFAASAMAISLGLDAQKVIDFTKDITVALSSDAEANKKVITDLMTGIADDIAATVAPSIASFAKDGETASTTLARLSSSIITANSWLSTLKQRLFQVSLAGGDAASRLADAFGGLDQLSASSKAFYDTYYTNAEKVSSGQEAMTNALKDYGIALPTSKAALRDLVDAMDLNTQSGREAYATLLKLAPQFAETAGLMDQMATDAAASLVKAFTANGKLVPALDAAALAMTGIQDGVTTFVDGISQVHTVMLDTSSPVISFNGYIESLSTGLTGAQASALSLQDQIEALSGASSKAVIDFGSLASALEKTDTTTFVATIVAMFESMATRIATTIDGIASERVAVRNAALQIINPSVMSKQAIQAGIAGLDTSLPSTSGLTGANVTLAAAIAATNKANANVLSNTSLVSSAATDKANLIAYYTGKNAELRALGNAYSPSGTYINYDSNPGDNAAYNYNADSNTLNPFNRISSAGYTNTLNNGIFGSVSTSYNPDVSGMKQDPRYSALVGSLNQGNAALAAAAQKIADAQAALAASKTVVTVATTAQTAAEVAAKNALLDYQKALQNFALDAGKSVSKLTILREETMKYYEAQKALADLMTTSAANLRSTVDTYRYGQLTPAQQAAQLQGQFALQYSNALAAQGDGTTLASYADKLNNTLGPLIDKLSGTGQDNLIASYLAQAETIAKLLEDTAPKNYQADSLALLGQIDSTLAALDSSTKSAENIIATAITAGSDRTAAGLHAVIAAITGGSVPAFATGAAFSRGGSVIKRPSLFNMGQMAEAGPEAIMPLANINGSLGVRVSGGSDAMVQELRALRQEVVNLRAESQATAIATGKTAKLLDGVVRGGDSINTVAAA